MFIQGLTDYDKNGQAVKTGLFAGQAVKDGSLYTTNSGKEVGSVSVIAYHRKDSTAAFLTVKGWGGLARKVSSVNKGDSLLAAGRVETHEYNGKTFTELTADFIVAGQETPFSRGVDVPADDFQELPQDDTEREDFPF